MTSTHRTRPGRPPLQTSEWPRPATRRARRTFLQLIRLRARIAYAFVITAVIGAGTTATVYALVANAWWVPAMVVAGVGAGIYVVAREHAHAWAAAYSGFRDHIVSRDLELSHCIAAHPAGRARPDQPTERLPIVHAAGAL